MSLYKLKPNLSYQLIEYTLCIYVPLQGTVKLKNLSKSDISYFNKLVNEGVNENAIQLSSIVNKLEKLNLLYIVREFSISQYNRTLHWLNFYLLQPEDFLKNLRHKKIAILGCGGLGSVIFQQSLQIGFKNYLIIDNAKVDCVDLNRQAIYRKSDVGSYKVDVLSTYAREEYSNAFVAKSKQYINKTSEGLKQLVIFEPDIIYHCIDTPPDIKEIVVEAILDLDSIIIYGSVGVETGTVGPLIIEQNSKIQYNNKCKEKSKPIYIQKGSIPMTNTIVASMMMLDVLYYLIGEVPRSLNELNLINFKEMYS